MSSVLDYQQCPQCKLEQADFEYNCRTFEEYLQCRRCGYSEVVIREGNSEGKVTYRHEINEGAGVLFYRWKDAIGFLSYYLLTADDVTKAEAWLREKLVAGDVFGGLTVVWWDGKVGPVEARGRQRDAVVGSARWRDRRRVRHVHLEPRVRHGAVAGGRRGLQGPRDRTARGGHPHRRRDLGAARRARGGRRRAWCGHLRVRTD